MALVFMGAGFSRGHLPSAARRRRRLAPLSRHRGSADN